VLGAGRVGQSITATNQESISKAAQVAISEVMAVTRHKVLGSREGSQHEPQAETDLRSFSVRTGGHKA
jgi:hypothetical protein